MIDLIIRQFEALQPYSATWESMQSFTSARSGTTCDEVWLLEHFPVFTQGLAGKPEHVLNPHGIPVIRTDRGGQVTYHGPGQLMVYLLLDLHRLKLSTRDFVRTIETCLVDYLHSLAIPASGNPNAPGIYVTDAKIGSIGLRVRRGYSYHGLAFNVDTDLTPFSYINPCGFKGLVMTQVKTHVPDITLAIVKTDIIPYIVKYFGYNQPKILVEPQKEKTPHEQSVHL